MISAKYNNGIFTVPNNGKSKLEQLEENLKSSEVIDLLDEEIQKELLSI